MLSRDVLSDVHCMYMGINDLRVLLTLFLVALLTLLLPVIEWRILGVSYTPNRKKLKSNITPGCCLKQQETTCGEIGSQAYHIDTLVSHLLDSKIQMG